MPEVDLGALTIPIVSAIFGTGWGACHTIMVRPLIARLTKLEAKTEAMEVEQVKELKELRRLRMGLEK